MRRLLTMLALLLPATALAQLPPAVQQGAREAEADCRGAGGRPSLTAEFQATHDFNGDGQPDYVQDYNGLDCQGAPSLFCGSAGCPVVVFLSPAYRPQPLGHVQAWRVEAGGTLPVMVLSLHGSSCGRVGAAGCERRIGWNGRELAALGAGRPPAAPAPQAGPAAPPPGPSGGTKGAEPGIARPAPGAAPPVGWEVRSGADGRAVAVAAGPGVVRAVTVLCHEGVPVVALALRARPPAGPVTFGLAGRSGRAQVTVTPGGGDVWYGDLRNSALPRLMTGSEAAMEVLVNGGMQGRLSLQGSTRAIREALGPCMRV